MDNSESCNQQSDDVKDKGKQGDIVLEIGEPSTPSRNEDPSPEHNLQGNPSNDVSEPTRMDNPESCNQSDAVMNKDKQGDTVVELGEPSTSSPNEDPSPGPNVQDNLSRDVHLEMYQAALGGNWKAAQKIMDKQKNIVAKGITRRSDNSLHIAVAANQTAFVENLLKKMERHEMESTNDENNTALHIAAALGAVKIAKMLVKANKKLHNIRGGKREILPIHLAALFRQGEMVRCLFGETKTFNDLDEREFLNLFQAIIEADIYDVALLMLKKEKWKTGANPLDGNGVAGSVLHLMARKPSDVYHKNQLNMFQKFAHSISKGFFCHEKKMQTLAHQFVEDLWKPVVDWPAKDVSKLLKSPTNIVFDAAERGNVEFLSILIRSYPDIIWMSDDNSLSLLHVAALNRHVSIFKMIYKYGGIKNLIASYNNKNTEDNMLHLVARLPPPNRLQAVSGAALQMQRELRWFNAVKEIVPQSFINTGNKKKLLAQDLFTKEHKSLCKQGERWMKETATACMLVATLIATVVFAAAFTIPGSYDDKTGYDPETNYHNLAGFPRFRKKFWFDVFIVSDSVSLLSSVTAIAFFLSILTSRYAEKDFLVALPRKLALGTFALFAAIISMVLAFTSTMILTRDQEPEWSIIVIICLASLTAISYTCLHFLLWFDTFCSSLSKML